ncbi:polyprenyl synthetase family protein [Plantactinospora sp. GCM10030261]|uniref:polyprenyl synthetase family protein n=1 Tax=Plantactinospora sp. GCM10030261 TaxID=3273420 RepID=UPI00361A3B8E
MANEAVAGNAIPLARLAPAATPTTTTAAPPAVMSATATVRPETALALHTGDDVEPGSHVDIRRAIEDTLTAFLGGQVDELTGIDPAVGEFAQVAREAVLAGGKRIRPTFAYWGWRGVVGEGKPIGPVLPALAALELLHAFALVHDDVMDASATRRGRPTAHRVLTAQHLAAGRDGDAARFGEAAAVLVGDLCLIWADRLLGHAGLSPGTILEARRCYDQMRVETVAGQYLDVLGETAARTWSVDRALRVARYKTASYTVQSPLLFGAALAGLRRDAALTGAYSRYGLAVGEAFQLRDDLLGVYGDPDTTGKPAGDDLVRGKPTALLMLARELATPVQRAALNEVDRDDPPVAAGRIRELADVVTATGAVARVERLIDQRVAEALTALDGAAIGAAARRALGDLAVAATHRRA